MGAVAVGLVASAGVGATICWSGCRCCRSTGWRRPGLSAARSAPTATATAVGTRPTSCWCAGRWRGPTATGRWGRCHRRCLMRMGVYARVSTSRQAQAQTIEQQLERLRAAVCERGWVLDEEHVYRDDGYSGASLGRPGLDRLRDHAALADLDVVLVVAPDRLARNYVHQVLLVDELARHGCRVEFLDRPMSQDPHDQLLLQIRGAVAEYERTLIAERMRRGRQARLRAGTLLPWTTPPFGYRLDAGRPRDPAAVRVEPAEAALVAQLFDWYLEPQATVYRLARRLTELGVATPMGKPRWNVASVRGILRNPAYTGRALRARRLLTRWFGFRGQLDPVGRGVGGQFGQACEPGSGGLNDVTTLVEQWLDLALGLGDGACDDAEEFSEDVLGGAEALAQHGDQGLLGEGECGRVPAGWFAAGRPAANQPA